VYGARGKDGDDKVRALDCLQRALLIARINASSGTDDGSSVDTDPDVQLALRNIAVLKGETVL